MATYSCPRCGKPYTTQAAANSCGCAKRIKCPTCNGTGVQYGTKIPCNRCNGAGTVYL